MRTSHIWLMACLCTPLTAAATTVAYLDDDELWAKADVVMVANVWRFAEDFDRTDYELEALECFKGCLAGQFLMMQSPGVSNKRPVIGTHEMIAGAPHPEVNDHVIVYLKKTGEGTHRLLSLGLGMFTMRYNNALRRYIAHRETDTLFIVRPTTLPARDASNQVLVTAETFASDVIEQLRQKAQGR